MKTVTITVNDAAIGKGAFKACKGTTSVVIPASATHIDKDTFLGCPKKVKVTFSPEVTCIRSYLFIGCTSLTNIIIPDTVTSIGIGAFAGCTGLKTIAIPASVTSIDNGAFFGCTGLSRITVDPKNPVYAAAGNCLIEKATKTVILACRASTIPTDGSVTHLGYYAFYGVHMKKIAIPGTVTDIDCGAVFGCEDLKRILFGKAEGWYRTADPEDFREKTGGTQMDVTDAPANARYFTSARSGYWYRK